VRIGVSISSRNRPYTLREAVLHWKVHKPQDSDWKLVIVDDASTPPVPGDVGVEVIHNPYRLGVAMTKNRGIEALMRAGCDHLFLADDDVWPVADGWWEPYVHSPEQHLSYQWSSRGRRGTWRKLHDDGTHWSINFPRGVLLYATRKVIDTVGGMDPAHGMSNGRGAFTAQD
jgi:GT2 family glycosyltransferase